jgi:hypothetical protein
MTVWLLRFFQYSATACATEVIDACGDGGMQCPSTSQGSLSVEDDAAELNIIPP